jgi:hypothetical protein
MNEWTSLLKAAGACRPVRENWTMRTDYAPPLDRLTQLACLLRAITWGQMTELGEGLARTGGGGPITQEELPPALHLWAMGRCGP